MTDDKLIYKFHHDGINKEDVVSVIDNYKIYPLYVIKYISTFRPELVSKIVIEHIKKTRERKCELIDCLMSSYTVKICDVLDIDGLCENGCSCYRRDIWKILYKEFLGLFSDEPKYFTHSYNINYSFAYLVEKTDVMDNSLYKFIKNISADPNNWRFVLKFIKDTELFSIEYGDIIFRMRDLLLENDEKPESSKNPYITKFRDRLLLAHLLKKYNEVQFNMSKITDNIYLTDINGAKNVSLIKDKKIDCVVTLTKRPIFRISDIEYIQIMIDDVDSVDFIKMTLETAHKIESYIRKNKKIILVHCYKGMSRSVCFVVLVLMLQGLKFQEAYKMVRTKRETSDPNPGFVKQLVTFAEKKGYH